MRIIRGIKRRWILISKEHIFMPSFLRYWHDRVQLLICPSSVGRNGKEFRNSEDFETIKWDGGSKQRGHLDLFGKAMQKQWGLYRKGPINAVRQMYLCQLQGKEKGPSGQSQRAGRLMWVVLKVSKTTCIRSFSSTAPPSGLWMNTIKNCMVMRIGLMNLLILFSCGTFGIGGHCSPTLLGIFKSLVIVSIWIVVLLCSFFPPTVIHQPWQAFCQTFISFTPYYSDNRWSKSSNYSQGPQMGNNLIYHGKHYMTIFSAFWEIADIFAKRRSLKVQIALTNRRLAPYSISKIVPVIFIYDP